MGVEILTRADIETFEIKIQAELEVIKQCQRDILEHLVNAGAAKIPRSLEITHVTARQFMDAVHIQRWKFNQLIANNKIKTIKKSRRIYVPVSEVDRFFTDSSIQ
jgi:hypothetical protein